MPKGTIPDLIIEQQFLYQMTNGKYDMLNLLGNNPKEVQENAIKNGYMHVLSINKVNELPLIKRELKYINNNIYNKVIEYATKIGCNNIETAK